MFLRRDEVRPRSKLLGLWRLWSQISTPASGRSPNTHLEAVGIRSAASVLAIWGILEPGARLPMLDDVWVDTSGQFLGPDVTLIRKLRDGDEIREQMPVMIAKVLLLIDPQNGADFVSARIDFHGLLDVW